MKHWVSEGNCLLKRKEKRFNLKNKDVAGLMRDLLATKQFTKEKFFGKYKSTLVVNAVYDVPQAKSIGFFRRKNYVGVRIREYISPDFKYISYRFGEWKKKENGKVTKTRECLSDIFDVATFFRYIIAKRLVFVMDVCYQRQALNSKDGKTRITFDKNTRYLSATGEVLSAGIGIEKEFTKVKVKFAGKQPKKATKIIERWCYENV